MRLYAQISGGICVAVTQTTAAPTPVGGDTFVEVPSMDGYLGRTYAAGEWGQPL